MKIFEIIDEEENLSIGHLLYFEKCKDFIIELKDYLDEWTSPMLFTSFVKKGIHTIPRDISFIWVEERVIPSGRQNIGSILSNHKLKAYDEMKLLELSSGRCSQDSLYIKKTTDLPEYIIKRRKKNLVDCVPLENNILLCFFNDDSIKKTNLRDIEDTDGISKILNNRQLYNSCTVGTGGYSASFDNAIDIPAALLYERGRKIPLKRTDFVSFLQRSIVDTSESCEILECSRQNLAYIQKKGQLESVKDEVKGNLFFKGDVLRNSW